MTQQFKTMSFEGEQSNFILPSWMELQNLCYEIAQQIKQEGKKHDRVITLAKGGWPMSRSLVDFLQVSRVASIGVRFYNGVDSRLPNPEVYQDLPEVVSGEKVILFDDVADTGESMVFAKNHLLEHGVESVETASLFYKPHSKIKPDYFAAETTAWIIFPYEVFESIKVLSVRWARAGLPEAEIKSRLLELGYANHYLDEHLKL